MGFMIFSKYRNRPSFIICVEEDMVNKYGFRRIHIGLCGQKANIMVDATFLYDCHYISI